MAVEDEPQGEQASIAAAAFYPFEQLPVRVEEFCRHLPDNEDEQQWAGRPDEDGQGRRYFEDAGVAGDHRGVGESKTGRLL